MHIQPIVRKRYLHHEQLPLMHSPALLKLFEPIKESKLYFVHKRESKSLMVWRLESHKYRKRFEPGLSTGRAQNVLGPDYLISYCPDYTFSARGDSQRAQISEVSLGPNFHLYWINYTNILFIFFKVPDVRDKLQYKKKRDIYQQIIQQIYKESIQSLYMGYYMRKHFVVLFYIFVCLAYHLRSPSALIYKLQRQASK